MNTEWVNFVIPLGLSLFYGHKIFFKKQKTATHGFLLGVMLILFVLSLSKIAVKFVA